MPQDLEKERQLEGLPQLAKEDQIGANSLSNPSSEDPISRSQLFGHLDNDDFTTEKPGNDMPEQLKELHPYGQILSVNDVESCLKLEESVFPPNQACSREKFLYRLGTCGELALGLFTSSNTTSLPKEAPTASTAHAPDSASPARKGILLAQLVATKTSNTFVRDEDMMLPPPEQSNVVNAAPGSEVAHQGHNEAGRTLAVHSLAVLPAYQRLGLGTTLMKAYVQRMLESDVADRISILTYESLVPFYKKLGFEEIGKSDVTYGGGDWINMVLEFERVRPQSDDE
ncbi:MAG: hypothetical protein M1831_002201 [Alyxoria varia]|nr:MAG: hypothetical protein M1831_002201 [Alyxoria varia]